jgi:VIT1/CCC1 family predicted Fe2+/Mn2+ transporter
MRHGEFHRTGHIGWLRAATLGANDGLISMAHDALAAHARDELGMSETTRARPIQAGLASAAAFAVGAVPPVLLVLFLPVTLLTAAVVGSTLVLLSVLGGTAARLGGARLLTGAARVAFWGAVAMGCTALIGRFFGTVA